MLSKYSLEYEGYKVMLESRTFCKAQKSLSGYSGNISWICALVQVPVQQSNLFEIIQQATTWANKNAVNVTIIHIEATATIIPH